MSECLKCGGSAYKPYAYGCEHRTVEDVWAETPLDQAIGTVGEPFWAIRAHGDA